MSPHTPIPQHSNFWRKYRVAPDDWADGFFQLETRPWYSPFWSHYSIDTFGCVQAAIDQLDEEMAAQESSEKSDTCLAVILVGMLVVLPAVTFLIILCLK